MYTMRIVNRSDLSRIITMGDAIEAVEKAYRLFSRKEAGVFPIIAHEFEPEKKEMDIKSGHLEGAGIYGLKVVGYSADNPQVRGIPALAGLVIVMSVETGQPLGLVDGMTITNVRTGAAGAVGARALARLDSEKVLIVGTGAQGRAQVEGLLSVMPAIKVIRVFGRTPSNVEAYITEMGAKYPNIDFYVATLQNLKDAALDSDIIVTCTPSHKPLIKEDYVKPGTHINAIGADFPGKQELDAQILSKALVVGDSREQVVRQGECQTACREGIIKPEDILEIGDILEGIAQGRTSDDQITVFDSTGMALQDIITAQLALKRAEEQGIGILVQM